jgi:hypothetical protein
MFLTIFLLYLRVVPAISIAEVKPVLWVGRKKGSPTTTDPVAGGMTGSEKKAHG